MCIRRYYYNIANPQASGVLGKTRNGLIGNRSARRTRKKCRRVFVRLTDDGNYTTVIRSRIKSVRCALHVVSEFIPRSTWPPFWRDGNHDNFRVVGYWLGTMEKTWSSPASLSASAVRFSLSQGKMHVGYNVLKNISKMVRTLYYSILKSSRYHNSEKFLSWLFEYNSVLNELKNRAVQY